MEGRSAPGSRKLFLTMTVYRNGQIDTECPVLEFSSRVWGILRFQVQNTSLACSFSRPGLKTQPMLKIRKPEHCEVGLGFSC